VALEQNSHSCHIVAMSSETLNINKFRANLTAWYAKNERPLPWRLMWKKTKDPWVVWVSEIMLQQTVIKAVIPVYESFLRRYPSFQSFAKATNEEARQAVRGLGYYRRFDMLHRASIQLTAAKRKFPGSFDEWKELPGIGDYTASAIASITAGESCGVVDGNVERVLCRLLDLRVIASEPLYKKQFRVLMNELVSSGHPGELNQAVMELGQTICTPTSPSCTLCPVSKHCKSKKNSSQALNPMAKPKQQVIDVSLTAYCIVAGDQIGLIRRDENSRFLKGTLGFPMFESTLPLAAPKTKRPPSQSKAKKDVGYQALSEYRHAITKHRIRVRPFLVEADHSKPVTLKFTLKFATSQKTIAIEWHPLSKTEELLVSNLDRKALKQLNIYQSTTKKQTISNQTRL
jgi:A/G-specific adenine glycosylase